MQCTLRIPTAITMLCALLLSFCDRVNAADEMQILKTPAGVRFGMVGSKGQKPAPTLFVFAGTARDALTSDDFFKSGRILRQKNWICVSLDVPCHGEDLKSGEGQGIQGWRT